MPPEKALTVMPVHPLGQVTVPAWTMQSFSSLSPGETHVPSLPLQPVSVVVAAQAR